MLNNNNQFQNKNFLKNNDSASLWRKQCFREEKIEILVSENSLKRREMWFLAGIAMCVHVYVNGENFETLVNHEYKSILVSFTSFYE